MSQSPNTDRGRANQLSGLLTVVGWIGAGAISLAAVLLALDLVVDLPLSRTVAVGLGLALGGGIGGVANLMRDGETPERSDETVTVDSDPTPTPQPADLFDDHPDPVLFYATEGHGPVVRAANEAYGETFDVPPDRLTGTPLSEALLVAGEDTVDVDAVTAGGLDVVVLCDTTGGPRSLRLRTVGAEDNGYLLYTPVQSD